jgi:hypothetical protein
MMTRIFWTTLLALGWYLPLIAAQPDYANNIASLIDPAKLATLGERKANPRVQECVHWLATAQSAGQKPDKVIDDALRYLRINKEPAALTKAALLRNLDIATKLGCLDTEGLAEMRNGNAPTIRRGPYKGDQLSVDHIIPRDICPELDNVIANLELMSQRRNSSKNDAVGARQVDLARKLNAAGLLTKKGLRAVESAAKKRDRR